MRVLIVEDDASLAEVVRRGVVAEGFVADVEHNGLDGLWAATERDYDVVILDPAKMTRDREQVIPALKKYLDMNKLALGAVKPGGLFATFSCTGLVREDQFLDMLRRAGYYAGRTLQVLKVSGAGADHPFLANVPESRYLKAVFCRVLD